MPKVATSTQPDLYLVAEPTSAGMKCINLDLRSRDVVLAPLVIRPELKLLEAELAQQPVGHGFSVLYGDILIHDHAACGVIAHQPGGILCLLPPEASVNGE